MTGGDRKAAAEEDRGRAARSPREISRRGWRDIAIRVKNQLGKDNLNIVAAGVAFYLLLALFPALAALVSIYGLIADPVQVQAQFDAVAEMMPPEAAEILRRQLAAVAESPPGALSLGLIFGLLLTLWSATRGIRALIIALNIVYGETEQRSFLRRTVLSLALTIGTVLLGVVVLIMVVALPAVISLFGLEGWGLVSMLRWPLLALVFAFALSVLYRVAPNRRAAQWRWVIWGAGIATLLWLIGSALFSLYVSQFGNFNETYGAVGAVIVLLMWLYLSAFIVLLGAEINAEAEHQTREDTTSGEPRPMGERGAYVADHLGPVP